MLAEENIRLEVARKEVLEGIDKNQLSRHTCKTKKAKQE